MNSLLIMFGKNKFRKGVFIIVYFRVGNKIKYIILKRKLHWKGWEFPKGGIEFLEFDKWALRREVKEETGLNVLKIKKFNIKGKYLYNKKFEDRKGFIGQTFKLYSAEVENGDVKIDVREHSGFEWVDVKIALKKLTWKNQRDCLKIIDKELKR